MAQKDRDVNQSNVRERLRKIAQHFTRPRIYFLSKQANIIAERKPQQTESLFAENHESFFNTIDPKQTSAELPSSVSSMAAFSMSPMEFRVYKRPLKVRKTIETRLAAVSRSFVR